MTISNKHQCVRSVELHQKLKEYGGLSSQATFFCQERTIERLKEQRDRDEREKQEEIDTYKKDIKDLKEKVGILQGDLTEKEVDQQNKSVVLHFAVCYILGEDNSSFIVTVLQQVYLVKYIV